VADKFSKWPRNSAQENYLPELIAYLLMLIALTANVYRLKFRTMDHDRLLTERLDYVSPIRAVYMLLDTMQA
jgi:hypothetical protein